MSFSKAGGALNAALRFHAAGDVKKAKTQAKTFFTYINKLAGNYSGMTNLAEKFFGTFSMTEAEIKLINELADRVVSAPVVEIEDKEPPKLIAEVSTKSKGSARDICYSIFASVDMNDSAARKAAINTLVEKNGFAKPSVQSYASNFRAGK